MLCQAHTCFESIMSFYGTRKLWHYEMPIPSCDKMSFGKMVFDEMT